MKYIGLHHSAVANTGRHQIYAVERYHKGKWSMKSERGWHVAYNYFCDVDGTRTHTRNIGEETMAQVGNNCDVPQRCTTISYCMAGNFNTGYPVAKQRKDFENFVLEMKAIYPKIKVLGHRELQKNRTCPGNKIEKPFYDHYNNLVANDLVDEEKQREILQSQLDYIKVLLAKIQKYVQFTKRV